ncbi:MAG: uroporphyrinogen-III synthase [Desulfurobacteriaceae bacterium]
MRVFISSSLSEELLKQLENKGFEVVAFPLIETKPIPFSKEEVIDFSPDFIIISSKNGVKHFFSVVPKEETKKATFIAVGSSTAEKLKRIGISPLIPQNFSGEGVVELLKELGLKELKNKKFLIVRPKVARKVVSEFLESQGFRVKEIVVYETVIDENVRDKLNMEIEKGFDLFAFTSPSNLKAFLELTGEKGKEALNSSKLIPIGHVTQKAIEKAGFPVFKLPEEYTLNGIVDLILKTFR